MPQRRGGQQLERSSEGAQVVDVVGARVLREKEARFLVEVGRPRFKVAARKHELVS